MDDTKFQDLERTQFGGEFVKVPIEFTAHLLLVHAISPIQHPSSGQLLFLTSISTLVLGEAWQS